MNEIEIKIDFTKGTLATKGIALITGDYASTMLKFTFDREDGTKIFEMKNPSDEVVYVGEIINGEVLLTSKVDVTTIHNNKTYTKYTKNDAIYWYQPTDNKLFTDEWVEVSTFNLEEYTKVQVNASLFSESGKYIFEVSLYKNDTKLTSTKGILPVKQEQVIVDDEIVEAYIPIFDQLMQDITDTVAGLEQDVDNKLDQVDDKLLVVDEKITEANNLDLDMTDTSGVVEATITKKDGTTKTVEVIDRNDYYDKDEVDAIQTTIEGEIPTNVSELNNDANYIDNTVNDLVYYTLATSTGSTIELSINSSTYVMTLNLKNSAGTTISTGSIDLPLETMVVSASYDSANKKIVLVLKNGSTIDVPVGDLVSGLQTEITNDNKLSSDLVDDTGHTNKFVTTSEKTTWNNKSDFSGSYNDLSNKPDLTLKEDKSNKVTSLSNTSTDTQYPSAKCVYDSQVAQDVLITELEQETDLILDQIPKGTATGQDITLNDSSNLPIKSIEISGNTEQETTTGKNLCPNNLVSQTFRGLTFTHNEDGSITINGTSTNGGQVNICNAGEMPLIAGTYTISSTNTIPNYTWLTLRDSNSDISSMTNLNQKQITLSVDKPTAFIYFYFNDGITINNLTIYPMLEKSSSATSYEPYTGGIASPNPDYPQEVKVVEKDNTIHIEGENLLDEEYYNNADLYNINVYKNTLTNIEGRRTLYTKCGLKESKTTISGLYLLLCNNPQPNMASSVQRWFVNNGEISTGTSSDFSAYDDIYLSWYPSSVTPSQIFETYNLMVSVNPIEDYKPYTGTNYSLNLGVRNLLNFDDFLTSGGATYTKNNGVYSITDMGNLVPNRYPLTLESGKTYTLSCALQPQTTENVRIQLHKDGTALSGIYANGNPLSYTFTAVEGSSYTINMTYSLPLSSPILYKYPQLEKGSIVHSYSEYGVEPLELCKIGDYKDVFVKPSGKNLVNSVETHKGINGTTGAITTENAYLGIDDYIPCKPNTTYTITFEHDVSSGTLYIGYKTQNGTYIERVSNGTSRTFTTPSNAYYMIAYSYYAQGFNTIGGYVMLNEGNFALPYEPYNNNKWYKKAYIGKVVLDGSDTGIQSISSYDEVLSYTGTGDSYQASFSNWITKASSTDYIVMSNYFKKAVLNDRITSTNIIYSYVDGVLRIASDISSKPNFKTWLSTHNTIVYYVLANPEWTLLNDTLQTQLDAIWNMKTNKNTTNISITSDDLKPYLDIVYRKDLETLLGG